LSLVIQAAEKCRRTVSGQRRQFGTLSAAVVGSLLSLAALGCGNSYRPVVAAINPVGPAGQPTKYAIAISNPTPTGPGLVTFVDFSGDSILNTTAIGIAPYYLALDATNATTNAGTGYTLNGDGTINSFILSPSTLLSNDVLSSSLLPSTPLPNSIFVPGTNIYITEPGRSLVAQLSTATFSTTGGAAGPALRQELPVGANPIYIVGVPNAPRVYSVSQGSGVTAGQVAAIENLSTGLPTISNTISVGVNPVYGVMSADSRRVFIMNRGSNTVSVINSQTNTLDSTTPTIPVGTAPVWGDLITGRNEVAVLNAGAGTTPGSVSILNTPLCSAVALPSNPACDPSNPIDATNFGQVLATIPVGLNPVVVSVLSDGSRAYVANSGATMPCSTTLPKAAIDPGNGCGTVSVVNLQTNAVEATITVAGHPTFLVGTAGTPTGKVYVTSTDTSLMTVLRTDVNQVQTYIDLQGRGGQVRVTAQ
jgi:YVTN family beta-propeller protein